MKWGTVCLEKEDTDKFQRKLWSSGCGSRRNKGTNCVIPMSDIPNECMNGYYIHIRRGTHLFIFEN